MPHPRKPSNKNVEREYRRKLRKIARHIGDLVASYEPITPDKLSDIQRSLDHYSVALEGWARNVGYRMVTMADKKEEKWWDEVTKQLNEGVRNALKSGDLRPTLAKMVEEQVELITSLPTEANRRVSELAQRAFAEGSRGAEIQKEIMRTGEVTESRARLIARTEVARTSSTLTQARARFVGSTQYIWRTAGDSDVRFGHRQMSGKVFEWNNPPAVNEGSQKHPRIMHHHPGEIWNCRCYPEPIVPE